MEESSTPLLLKSKVSGYSSKFISFLRNFKPWRKPRFWVMLGICLLVFIFLTAGGITLYIFSLDIGKLQTPLAQPSYLYDQKGSPISELSSSRIEPVSGQQIPLIMKRAVIAVEDRHQWHRKKCQA